MNFRLNLWILAIVFMGTGCAVGRTLSFNNMDVKNNFSPTQKIAVAAVDMREDVLSGKKKPTYCGVLNSSVQIGYNINTKTGLPLSDEFATSLANSLKPSNPVIIKTVIHQDAAKLMNDFKATGTEKLLALTINKWEARGIPQFITIRYEVIYDLTLTLFDKNANALAEKRVHDIHSEEVTDLGVSVKKLNAMASDVFTTQLQTMLNELALKDKVAITN